MFEQLTSRARKVMGLSRVEVQRLKHESIGTEHILLGLVQVGSGVAAKALKTLGFDLKNIRKEVERLVPKGKIKGTRGLVPFTPHAKRVLELAVQEAITLGHNEIGTEHILVGLMKEEEGKAATVLQRLGVTLEAVQEEIGRLRRSPKPESL